MINKVIKGRKMKKTRRQYKLKDRSPEVKGTGFNPEESPDRQLGRQ